MPAPLKALDLFAGTGWGVACQRLGIEEMGVEIMPEAVATRDANGMTTIYRDVWEGLGDEPLDYDILIASPPCQTFSMAGKGAGRQALDEVIEAITAEAYKDPAALLAFGELHDLRTALVLTPLAHVWRDRPRYVAMEQVPTVLPVWEACAEVMRGWGYSVEVANLHAEQYGVPQTRKRAILVARLDGPVSLPTATHSRYYSRTPEKVDKGVLPWVSMAEALGWDDGTTFTQNNKLAHQSRRPLAHPAPTVTAGHDSGNRGFLDEDGALRVATPDEVAALQSYPSGLVGFPRRSDGKDEVDLGGVKYRARDLRPETHPSQTVTEKARSWSRFGPDGSSEPISVEEASALQSYPSAVSRATAEPRPAWAFARPSTTVVGTFSPEVISAPAGRAKGGHSRQSQPGSVKVTQLEAAALQSYPADPPFVWKGSKSKQFLQIGNAVPPLLAQAILSALTA